MRPLLLTLLGCLALTSAPAFAKPHHHKHHHKHHAPRVVVHSAPAVRVAYNPWAPAWRPAARAGYVWADGYYHRGRWVPGYWSPAYARAGYAWVPGHWNGPDYVEGYWRPVGRSGYEWVEGYYDERGDWVDGYWAAIGAPPARVVEGPVDDRGHVEAVHHGYEE